MAKYNLVSALKNRVELWENIKVDTPLGKTKEPKIITKLWSDVIPLSGVLKNGQADTEYSNTNFKIRVRKSSREFRTDMWFIFKGQRYDIKYMLPDFETNAFIDIYCNLLVE